VKGGHIKLHNWRRDHWNSAVRAAGLEHRTPYALRHTFASFAIAAGIATFEIARMMGTSIEQIAKTYGHLLPDALDRGRAAPGSVRHGPRRSVWALNGHWRPLVIAANAVGAPRFELGTSSPPD
jgi:hypothetical protein